MTTEPTVAEQPAGPIVLVHGAWVGEWCWEPVQRALHGSPRTVVAVSLTGHGSRSAESGPYITLDTHVDDVVAVVETADLRNITLVGHSYGGRVITRAWRRLADRVAALVYVDAHAPVGPVACTADRTHRPAADAAMVPFRDFHPSAELLGGEEALAAFYAGVMPQSARALDAPFFEALPADLPKTYVAATAETDRRFRPYHAGAAADPHWRYVELDATHWLLSSHADDVAAAILGAVHP